MVLAGLAVYALFLIAAPFEHNDLLWDAKTARHCTACVSSLLGSCPDAPATLDEWSLPDAGRAIAGQIRVTSILLPVRTTGRSPPVHV